MAKKTKDTPLKGLGLGTWSHSVYDFGDQDSIKRHADRLADGGFDLLIPCVKNPPGAVDFFTDVADVNPKYPKWDPLRVLITECRARRIKVHPWFCVYPEGEKARLLREHPEYKAEFQSNFPWACACRTAVQDYLFRLYESLAVRYEPDGLHLDYIRAGGNCTCAHCRSEMQKKGVDITTAEYWSPGFRTWVEWRIANVTWFVSRMRQVTKKQGMELSAAVFSNYPDCTEQQAQDWVHWGADRLVDHLFPMNYSISVRMAEGRAVSHVALVKDNVPLWAGLSKQVGKDPLSTEDLELQIRASLMAGMKGVVLFHYPAVTDADIAMLKRLRGKK